MALLLWKSKLGEQENQFLYERFAGLNIKLQTAMTLSFSSV